MFEGPVPLQELGSGVDFAAGSNRHQSQQTIAGPAHALRLGVWRQTHQQSDAKAFHRMCAAAKSW